MQKHTIDKTALGYNKQTDISKKTKFVPLKKVNPNKVSKKKNTVHPKPKAKTYHYCMKRGTHLINAMLRDLMFLEVNMFGFSRNKLWKPH